VALDAGPGVTCRGKGGEENSGGKSGAGGNQQAKTQDAGKGVKVGL